MPSTIPQQALATTPPANGNALALVPRPGVEAPRARPFAPEAPGPAVAPRVVGKALRPEEPKIWDRSTGRACIEAAIPEALATCIANGLWILNHPDSGCFAGPDGLLAQISDSGTRIIPVNAGELASKLAHGADWGRGYPAWDRGGQQDPTLVKRVMPPAAVVGAIAARTESPGFREVVAIRNSPFFAWDGRGGVELVTESGYHEPSKTWLWLSPSSEKIEVPIDADRDDARRALSDLLYLVKDFPMLEASRFAFVAAMLAVLCKSVIGPTPLFLIVANLQGTGKTLLATLISIIVQGRMPSTMGFSSSDEEVRKALMSVLREGPVLVAIDNITGTFDSPALAIYLTAEGTYSDRDLGVSRMIHVQPEAVVVATANNAALGPDMVRRTCPMFLRTDEERPDLRSGFSEPDLIEYVKSTRAQWVAALLTIMQAYLNADSPNVGLTHVGGFRGFTKIRSAIVWAGGLDPMAGRALLEQSREDAGFLGRLLQALRAADPNGLGLTAAEIVARGTPGAFHKRAADPGLAEALDEVRPPTGALTPKALSRRLNLHRDQNVGGLILRRVVSRTNTAKYFAERKV